MKSSVALFVLLLSLYRMQAQLPDGAIAPDFTATDINGQSWHLYDLLDQGKIVVLEISATWCPPCWAYHSSHAMQEFYETHGPSGDGKVQVLFVEGDPSTNLNCLYGQAGCNSQSPGNWVAGTPYPIFNNAQVADLYAIEYYPTIFAICPNRKLYELDQLDADGLWQKANQCPVAFGQNNAGIFQYDKGLPGNEVCGEETLNTHFKLINLGATPLQNADIELRWNNNLVDTLNWTGYLSTYGEADIQFDPFQINSAGSLKTSVTYINNTADEDPSNNHRSDVFVPAPQFNANQVLLKIRTDQYGAELYWELRDDFGNVLDWGGNQNVGPNGGGMFPSGIGSGPGAYGSNIIVKDTLNLPEGGCYSIHFVDAYGDGICCNYGNGYYKLYNLDNPVQPIITGGEYGVSDDRGFGTPVVTATQSPSKTEGNHWMVFPNPVSDQLHIRLSLAKESSADIQMVNMLGQMVWRQIAQLPAGNSDLKADVRTMKPGLYLLRVDIGGSIMVRKVVVQM